MLILFLFFLIITDQSFAIDVGNGSDGTCDVSGAATTQITAARKSYQCTTLNIDGNLNVFRGDQAGAGGAILLIKVQGNVTIGVGNTIDLTGNVGANGNIVAIAAGGAAGAGGSAGGSSTLTVGASGSGSGGGTGGLFGAFTGVSDSIGGGGGGGSYGSVGGTLPLNGDQNGSVIAAGTNGVVFGAEINFDTSFVGGSGGAAGGSAFDLGNNRWFGSAGGGGGGAIRILSGGNIVVDGSIISNGGAGGGTAAEVSSGGGGGGSGGAIWLQAAGTLTVSATGVINATGGAIGINSSGFLGFGGDGGNGRVRLDDADGAVTNLGAVSPAAFSTTFVPTAITSGTSELSRQYSSSISCAKVLTDDQSPLNNLINVFLGIMIAMVVYLISDSKKGKI